jgi:hypothetical protein
VAFPEYLTLGSKFFAEFTFEDLACGVARQVRATFCISNLLIALLGEFHPLLPNPQVPIRPNKSIFRH